MFWHAIVPSLLDLIRHGPAMAIILSSDLNLVVGLVGAVVSHDVGGFTASLGLAGRSARHHLQSTV